jgi:hypothetical protein
VGAIANEANLPGKHIGPIEIFDDFSVVGVPAEFQAQVLTAMAGATVRGQAANIRPATSRDPGPRDRARRNPAPREAEPRKSAPHNSAPREAERHKPRYDRKRATSKPTAPKKKAFKHKKK